jgi:hypothetical protein
VRQVVPHPIEHARVDRVGGDRPYNAAHTDGARQGPIL